MTKQEYENLGSKILDCALEAHRNLGPGLLESVYELCLIKELKGRNLSVKNQVELPVFYKGGKIEQNFYNGHSGRRCDCCGTKIC